LIILLATLVPQRWHAFDARQFTLGLLLAGLFCVTKQHHFWSHLTVRAAATRAATRALYRELGEVIVAQPEPRHYGLYFDEIGGPFWCQVYYDRHVRLDPANQTFMSIHDTYYRARWANQSGAQIGALLLADLERRPNALAVVLDDPGRLVKMD